MLSARLSRGRNQRHGVGFWLVAAAFVVVMAFGAVPTPLYPLYMQRDGFSTFTLTIVFAIYAVGVLVSLILAGHVSDWIGRKKILLAALAIELVAAVLFLFPPALPVLLIARLVTGLGIGMLTATATAHLHELHTAHRPNSSPQRFEIVSTAANIGGIGVGPLIAGIIAAHVSTPLRVPYVVFVVLLVLSMAAVAATPETVQEQLVRPTYRPQRISVAHGDRAGFLGAAIGGFTSFAVFGVFTSVAPGFVSGVLDRPSHVLAGLVVFIVFGAGAAGQLLTSRLPAPVRRRLGVSAQAAGLALVVAGMQMADFPTFLIGGAVAGIGAGVFFKSAVGTVAGMAAPAKRGEALAGLFLIGYLGLAVPVVGIGIASRFTSASAAMTWFAGAVVLLLVVTWLLAEGFGRNRRPAVSEQAHR